MYLHPCILHTSVYNDFSVNFNKTSHSRGGRSVTFHFINIIKITHFYKAAVPCIATEVSVTWTLQPPCSYCCVRSSEHHDGKVTDDTQDPKYHNDGILTQLLTFWTLLVVPLFIIGPETMANSIDWVQPSRLLLEDAGRDLSPKSYFKYNKKFWEEVADWFLLLWHGWHRKRHVQLSVAARTCFPNSRLATTEETHIQTQRQQAYS